MSKKLINIDTVVIPVGGVLTSGLYTPGNGEKRCLLNLAYFFISRGIRVFIYGSNVLWGSGEPIPKLLNLTKTLDIGSKFIYFSYEHNFENLMSGLEDCCLVVNFKFDCFKQIPVIQDKSVIVHSYLGGTRYLGHKAELKNKFFFLPFITPAEDYFKLNSVSTERDVLFWSTGKGFAPPSTNSLAVKKLIEWVSLKLKENEKLKFYMVVDSGLTDLDKKTQEIVDHSFYKKYLKCFKDRVHLIGGESYEFILNIMKKTKLLLNVGYFKQSYAGSPIEAAFNHIPIIGYNNNDPFTEMPGFLETDYLFSEVAAAKRINIMKKLLKDTNYYNLCGNRVYEYASSIYSSENFIKQFDLICNNYNIRLDWGCYLDN